MSIRQTFLRTVYPVYAKLSRASARNIVQLANDDIVPPVSFYSLSAELNNGTVFDFEKLRGKKVLLVNTASSCGFTAQYDQLQKLYRAHEDKLVVLAFPSNDFKKQEPEDDETIAAFCQAKYRVSFPLVKKTVVLRKTGQHPVFAWLSDAAKNGWNKQPPKWNFCKYLINEKGMLTNFFAPAFEPLGPEITAALGL